MWVSSPIGVGRAAVVGDWIWKRIERVSRLLRKRRGPSGRRTDGSRVKAREGGGTGIGRKRVRKRVSGGGGGGEIGGEREEEE